MTRLAPCTGNTLQHLKASMLKTVGKVKPECSALIRCFHALQRATLSGASNTP